MSAVCLALLLGRTGVVQAQGSQDAPASPSPVSNDLGIGESSVDRFYGEFSLRNSSVRESWPKVPNR